MPCSKYKSKKQRGLCYATGGWKNWSKIRVRGHKRSNHVVRPYVRGMSTSKYSSGFAKGSSGLSAGSNVSTEALLDRLESGTLNPKLLSDKQRLNIIELQEKREQKLYSKLKAKRRYRELEREGKVY